MRLPSRKIRTAGLVTLLAAAGVVMPALPASADKCGVTIPCIPDSVGPITPDLFGDLSGYACGGVFSYEGDEGTRLYWSGPIQGATYVDSDVQTQRMTVTCFVQDADTVGSGTLRGTTTAQSIAPLNNIVSAAGLDLEYWKNTPGTERIWLCTTVRWVDRAGLSHSHSYDANSNRSGAQCPELVPLIPAVAS
jgi:hypothetical protein